jgi:hypothetical protein
MPVFIDDALAVFLEQFGALRRQQIDDQFGRTAKARAFRRYDDRPIHQDRMRRDGVQERVIGKRRVPEAEFMEGRSLLTQNLAHGQTGPFKQLRQ